MKTLRWDHLPCDDDAGVAAGGRARVQPIVARLLCLRGLGDPDRASASSSRRSIICTIRSSSPTWPAPSIA